MKVVAITRVRNEMDIIEAFVRHTRTHVDKLLVLDDGSTDETPAVLRALGQSGLPLVVLGEQAIAYEQSRYMTRLLRMAVEQFGADWVVPLDADEFLELRDGEDLKTLLAESSMQVRSMFWTNFAWSAEPEAAVEPNPVRRLRLRLPRRLDVPKVIVPGSMVDERAALSQGNHALLVDGQPVPALPLERVQLCHFPIRDVAQYATKVAIGYLKYRATPHWDGEAGFQYVEPFRTLVTGGLAALEDRMPHDSRVYSLKVDGRDEDRVEMVDCPLQYRGAPLAFRARREPTLSAVLRLAEDLAQAVAADGARREATVPDIDLLRREHTIAVVTAGQLSEDMALLRKRTAALEAKLLEVGDAGFVRSEECRHATSVALRCRRLAARIFPSRIALRTIRSSRFFDPDFYMSVNPEVKAGGIDPSRHYLVYGAALGRDPGPSFSTTDYLNHNPDVAAAGLNPLVHFELHGRAEGRLPTASAQAAPRSRAPSTAPAEHPLAVFR